MSAAHDAATTADAAAPPSPRSPRSLNTMDDASGECQQPTGSCRSRLALLP